MTHISREDALRELSGIVGRQFFGASGSYYGYELRAAYQKSLEALASHPAPADREAIVEECAQTIERCGARDALSIAVIVRRLADETPGPSTFAAKRFSSVSESRHGEPAPVFTDCQGNNPEPRDPAPASAEVTLAVDHDKFERIIAQWAEDAFKRGFASSWHFGELWAQLTTPVSAAPASPLGQEWRDIETAPKDTAVLVYGFGYEVAHYNTALGVWVACWDHRILRTPEKWQPLPAAPTLTSAQAPEGSK